MASLEPLSDAEIRTKLFNLGCEVGPVTPTTRKVYLKKLNSLLQGEQSIGSGEKSRPPPASSQSYEDSIFKDREKSTISPKQRTTRPAADVHPLASSTFVEPAPSPKVVKEHRIPAVSETKPHTKREVTPPEKIVSSSTSPLFQDPFRNTGNFNNLHGYNGTSGSKYNSPPYISSGSALNRPKLSDFERDQPYASDFTRRLSNSSLTRINAQTGGSPRSPLFNSKIYDNVKESDDEEDGSGPISARFGPSTRGQQNPRDSGRAYPLPYGGWLGKDASVFILGSVALFFVIVAYAYFHMHHSDSSVSPYVSELAYPRCNGLERECIPDHDIKKATTVFKILWGELNEIAARSGCSTKKLPAISVNDAYKIVNLKDSSVSVYELDTCIHYAGILANSNPSWNVAHTTQEGFRLKEIPTSIFCTLVNQTMSMFYWIIRILLCMVVVVTVYSGIKWWSRVKSKHQEEVMRLFSQIIDLVSSTAVQDGPGFAVISHIRDRLIPAHDKTSKMKLWEEAMSLLESDSRVRTEVQQVEGEDFLVWRWLAPPPNPKRKVWQGQAFETMDGSVNSLPESPTPCLKIRHMFDPSQEEGDGWVSIVADAILEKCKDATIYHIVVEKQSPEGCVYVKCASPRDAGIAYKALHGFWFDTKLVTVKYIREGRYLERFPDSARAKYPLVPSSKRQN